MIRLLTSQDAPLYKSLRLKALQTDGQYYQSTYEIESKQPDSFFIHTLYSALISPIFGYYGFFVGTTLAGYIQLEKEWSPKKVHTAKLINLYVDPEFRGQNIGTKLFEHVTKLAQEIGIEQLSLQCNANNINAQKLYTKQGFSEYGRKKDALKWNGRYEDIVFYNKKI